MNNALLPLLLCLMPVIGALAQLCLKAGSGDLAWKALCWTGGGIFFFVLNSVIFTSILEWLPLGKAMPFVALVYLLTPLCGALFFREKLKRGFWLGALLICAGICLTAI